MKNPNRDYFNRTADYHPLLNYFGGNLNSVDDDPIGCWTCSVDRGSGSAHQDVCYNILEMHEGASLHEGESWDTKPSGRIVFRVSRFEHGDVRLGDCAILDKKQAWQLHRRLGEILSKM